MGIQGLGTYLGKKVAPQYVKEVDIAAEGIKRVAIDGHQWLTSMMKVEWKQFYMSVSNPFEDVTDEQEREVMNSCLSSALRYTSNWLEIGITPVWVLDGPAPVEKNGKQVKRRETRARATERFNQLKEEIDESGDQNEEEPVGDWIMDEELQSKEEQRRKAISYRQQENGLNPRWVSELRDLLLSTGVPTVQALTEGEKVACLLWHEGKVDAVVSNDTDTLAYQCRRVITRGVFSSEKSMMPMYDLDYIQAQLGLTPVQFLDFCIACGCDYNTNIPKIGPVKVHELIRAHGSIDAFPSMYKKIPMDVSVLNHVRCRELFSISPSEPLIRAEKSSSPPYIIDEGKYTTQREQLISRFGRYTGSMLDNQLQSNYQTFLKQTV